MARKEPSLTVTAVLFVSVLVLSGFFRQHTLRLPHFAGDQGIYGALAYKIASTGLENYNLRGIDISVDASEPNLYWLGGASDKGYFLKKLAADHVTYFDEPLHHVPWGFPMALILSHGLFQPGEHYSLSLLPQARFMRLTAPGVGLRNFHLSPEVATRQFYLVIVPLAFSILLIASTFLLGLVLYESRVVALVSMMLMAISPIDIFTSQRVWADDMTAAFSTASVVLFLLALKGERPWISLIAGIACGLATVTKQNGAFVAIGLWIWHWVATWGGFGCQRALLRWLFDRRLLLFGVGFGLSAGYWFFQVYSVYGTPFYLPERDPILSMISGWYRTVADRPSYVYLLGIPYQNPLFALAYLSPLLLWLEPAHWRRHLLPIIWIGTFLILFGFYLDGGREHRYMLPAYPAFAVASAYISWRLSNRLDEMAGFRWGSLALVLILVGSTFWSTSIGLDAVFGGGGLIKVPF